jgi:hypothetical protein
MLNNGASARNYDQEERGIHQVSADNFDGNLGAAPSHSNPYSSFTNTMDPIQFQ